MTGTLISTSLHPGGRKLKACGQWYHRLSFSCVPRCSSPHFPRRGDPYSTGFWCLGAGWLSQAPELYSFEEGAYLPPPEQSPSQALLSPSNPPTLRRKQLPRCRGGWALPAILQNAMLPRSHGNGDVSAGSRSGAGGAGPTDRDPPSLPPPRTGVCPGRARLRGCLGVPSLLPARGTSFLPGLSHPARRSGLGPSPAGARPPGAGAGVMAAEASPLRTHPARAAGPGAEPA